MQNISIIITTQTPKGIKRQKADINKAFGFVTVNGIVVPKVKTFGQLTMTTISSIVVNPEAATEKAIAFLDQLKRTEIAKKANGLGKAKKKKAKSKAKPKTATKRKAKPAKAKKNQPERLPKHEYFILRATESFKEGDHKKCEYYLSRLEEFKDTLTEEQKSEVSNIFDALITKI